MISKKYSQEKNLESGGNNDKIITWQCLKDEILNSPRWLVNLDIYDLNDFEGVSNKIVVQEAVTDDPTESRFCKLVEDIKENFLSVELSKHIDLKLLIYLQFPLDAPIMMSEMLFVNNLVDDISSKDDDCEIKIGMSPRKDNISRIVCAISYYTEHDSTTAVGHS